jgi:hypothetical protein
MSDRKRPLRWLGGGLIAAGIVLLVMLGGYLVFNQLRGAQTRGELRPTPPVVATSVPVLSATVVADVTPIPDTSTPKPSQPALESTQPAPTGSLALSSATPEPPVPAATPIQLAVETVTPTPVLTATTAPTATNAFESVPVRLTIPDLKMDVPVVEMGWRVVQTADGPRSDWVIPKNEAGHHINSALLGDDGNLVISGHNNIFGEVFKPISFAWDNDTRIPVDSVTDRSDLLNGRTIELFDAAGREFKYTIAAFYRLKDTGVSAEQRIANGRFMEPTDRAQVTLITCWPPTSNTHRLVVVAVPATN